MVTGVKNLVVFFVIAFEVAKNVTAHLHYM